MLWVQSSFGRRFLLFFSMSCVVSHKQVLDNKDLSLTLFLLLNSPSNSPSLWQLIGGAPCSDFRQLSGHTHALWFSVMPRFYLNNKPRVKQTGQTDAALQWDSLIVFLVDESLSLSNAECVSLWCFCGLTAGVFVKASWRRRRMWTKDLKPINTVNTC